MYHDAVCVKSPRDIKNSRPQLPESWSPSVPVLRQMESEYGVLVEGRLTPSSIIPETRPGAATILRPPASRRSPAEERIFTAGTGRGALTSGNI